MGITYSNKEVNTDSISCGGTFEVTLSLTAAPDIVSNPADIVLILDRSGSMAGSPLANMKNGARKFIDIIADATGGTQTG
ncbi:MAG: VWA domain-containing protein, partial [Oscillospiraceae bacterium]|nr:VWA domain-containing protein [Oscillospiraceae bacterium]